MKKRGMLETQLKFIFVAIAGGLIILFFFSLVQKQKQISEQEIAEKISRSFGNSLSMAQTTGETEQTLQLPQKLKLEFDCETASIRVKGAEKKIPQYTIFAPNKIEDYSVITQVKPLQLPFTITNLLYATSPNIRYVIVYDDANKNFAEDIYSKLAKDANKELVKETEQIQDKNNYGTKLVLLTATVSYYSQLPESVKKGNLRIITVEKEATTPGKIAFYSSQLNKEGEILYMTDAMLLAAVFSDSYEQYSCAMNNAMKKMPAVVNTHLEKMNMITQNTAMCSPHYQIHAIEPLKELKKAAESRNIAKIKEYSEKIEKENTFLEEKSCPTIY